MTDSCTGAGYAPLILSSVDGVCTVVELPEGECLCAPICGLTGTTGGGGSGPTGGTGPTGATGPFTTQVYVYQVLEDSDPTPTAPTNHGSLDYTWATGTLTGSPDNGWVINVPTLTSNGYKLWRTTAVVNQAETGVLISNPQAFSNVAVIGESGTNGSNGSNGATGNQVTRVSLFQAGGTSLNPAVPIGTALDYVWADGTLVGSLGSWTQAPPTVTAGNYLWETIGLAQQTATTDTQNDITSYTTAAKVGYAGVDGVDGTTGTTGPRVTHVSVFQTNSGSPTPAKLGDTDVDYTWSTGAITGSIGAWLEDPPEVPAGNVLWESIGYVQQSLFSDATNDITDFTNAQKVSRSGSDGAVGATGPSSMIESSVADGWARLGNSGHWSFTGPAPQNGYMLRFYDSAMGGSGGIRSVPAPLSITSLPGAAAKTGGWSDEFLLLNADGTTGPTGMTEFHTGITFGSTGAGKINADNIQQADGTYKSLAATPLEELGNATAPDTAADFNNVAPTFRKVTAGAAGMDTTGGYSGNGQLKIGQTGTIGGDLVVGGGYSGNGQLNIGQTGTIGGELVVAGDGKIGKSLALSGLSPDPTAAIHLEPNGTVDVEGTVNSSYATQLIPHIHGTFIWTVFASNSNTGTTSQLGRGLTDTADMTVTKSIPIGGAAGDTTFMEFTLGTADDGSEWSVGDSVGVYKVTLHAVVANSAVNPSMTLNIKRNGTAVHSVVNNSYSVISPQSMSMEWIGATRSSWPITVDCAASTGNATLMAGTTLSIVRIA